MMNLSIFLYLIVKYNVYREDVYREDNFVYVSKTHTNYCPVSILDRDVKTVNINLSCNQPIFRSLIKKKSAVTVCGTENILTLRMSRNFQRRARGIRLRR